MTSTTTRRHASEHAAPTPTAQAGKARREEMFRAMDQVWSALRARHTGGMSPAALYLALFDWSMHLASAPGKQMEIGIGASQRAAELLVYILQTMVNSDTPPVVQPLPGDHRFRNEAWTRQPWQLLTQTFLMNQQWWHTLTHGVPGVSPHHEDMVSFAARQILDVFSPSNFPFTNPEVIDRTLATGGMNFIQGAQNWLEDVTRQLHNEPPAGAEKFKVGEHVAVTPGTVIYRNDLIELIQYAPATQSVFAEPVLIVPAWIMKYYILDLSPHNSLIRYLVSQGHTVFCISWRNPTAADRDLGMDDYRRLGVMAALDAVTTIIPDQNVHAVGYCLGGTLLAIAAAAMGCRDDHRLASMTLLAAQTDFSEPGELALFIDHSQMHYLASAMWNRGFLSADQMEGAFQLLRSNDLIWSQRVREYLLGERRPMIDLMAWNADSTRMPYRMHTEYLQRLYLDNELAAGRYIVDGRPAALQNIRVPIFAVGTERDHVAPWQSVYKIHYLTDTDVRFVLTSSGHNAGIISEPGRPRRHYRVNTKGAACLCQSPDDWARNAEVREGSWWPEWASWLASHSDPQRVPARTEAGDTGRYAPIGDAPGTYVLQR